MARVPCAVVKPDLAISRGEEGYGPAGKGGRPSKVDRWSMIAAAALFRLFWNLSRLSSLEAACPFHLVIA